MRACILAVGDEIVSGLTTDTNSPFLAQLLRSAGVEVAGFFAVADEEDAIVGALERALEDAPVVITTGGLGPTVDDLTTLCISRLAGRPLQLDEAALRAIEDRFRTRGLEMPSNNRKQALFPAGSTILANPDGTAPGFVCSLGEGAHVISLPGVPREMRRMAEEAVLPWLVKRSAGLSLGSRVFSTVGLTESRLDELLVGVIAPGEGRLSLRAAFPRLQARVTVTASTGQEVDLQLNALERRVRQRLGDHLYAIGDEGLEETAGRLLRRRKLTLAVAESCTGGLIGHRLTDVPGSSEYFLLGVVAYSNAAKHALLGVAERTLARHGAVSEEVVKEMAEGVRRQAGADLGLATSGIAGPGGGTPEKPVGTVCVAMASEGSAQAWSYDLGSRSRGWVKEMAAQVALDRLRRQLASITNSEDREGLRP